MMPQVAHASRAVQLILDMLSTDDRGAVLQQLQYEHGIRMDAARLYPDREVAARYGVHVRTARNWIASGRLKGCQINGKWYSRADWMASFEEQHVPERKEA